MTKVDPDSVRIAAVGQWSVKATRLIDARIGDARAHAWNAITQRVVTAPDGRKTWRQAVLTRSYQAAVTRLDELADELAGPSKYSLDGLIRDARAAFYRDAFKRWNFEPQYLAPNPVPTKSGERVARGLVIHGFNLRDEVSDAIQAAKSGLQAAVTMAGRQDMTDDQSRAVLDGWESQKANAIKQRANDLLNDSYVAIYNLVGREMIDPKFYAEDE